MPLKFGGDMDDPDNPASPFMPREDVENVAGELAGLTPAQVAAARSAAPDVVDLAASNVTLTREEALDMMLTGVLAQVRNAVKDLRAAREQGYWGDVQNVWENLEMFLPE